MYKRQLKQRIVHDVLEKYKDISKDDALGILSSVGGFEFACIVDVYKRQLLYSL